MTTQRGFTLIEMAIVLVIITILIGGLAVPLSAQIQARRIAETNKTLEEAREAIIGYAIAHRVLIIQPEPPECECVYSALPPDLNTSSSTCDISLCPAQSSATPLTLRTRHYLPCPDLNGTDPEPDVDNDGVGGLTDLNNGVEDRYLSGPNQGACSASSGNLPWVTLGTAMQDAWGNHLHYRVTSGHSNSVIGFSTASVGDNQVCVTAAGACDPGTLARDVPVVLISFGPNGWGARNVNGSTLADPTSAVELENVDRDNQFISRAPIKAGDPSGPFDDLVVWISDGLLSTRGCPNGECSPQLPPPPPP